VAYFLGHPVQIYNIVRTAGSCFVVISLTECSSKILRTNCSDLHCFCMRFIMCLRAVYTHSEWVMVIVTYCSRCLSNQNWKPAKSWASTSKSSMCHWRKNVSPCIWLAKVCYCYSLAWLTILLIVHVVVVIVVMIQNRIVYEIHKPDSFFSRRSFGIWN